jgi:PKD repeat protein
VKYEWHFGTGGGTVQATGAVVSRSFAAAGTYNVTLKVTDNVGIANSATQAVTVTP